MRIRIFVRTDDQIGIILQNHISRQFLTVSIPQILVEEKQSVMILQKCLYAAIAAAKIIGCLCIEHIIIFPYTLISIDIIIVFDIDPAPIIFIPILFFEFLQCSITLQARITTRSRQIQALQLSAGYCQADQALAQCQYGQYYLPVTESSHNILHRDACYNCCRYIGSIDIPGHMRSGTGIEQNRDKKP